jgi:hypothetical protein
VKNFDVQFTSNRPLCPDQITVQAEDQSDAIRKALAQEPDRIRATLYDRKTDKTNAYGTRDGNPWGYFTISVSEGY